MAAVTAGAGIDNTDNDAGRGTLGFDADLVTASRARARVGAHLVLVQGNDHVVLGETDTAGSGGIAEPGTATAVDLAGVVDRGLGGGLGGLGNGGGLGRLGLGLLRRLVRRVDQLPVDGLDALLGELSHADLGEIDRVLVATVADVDDPISVSLGGLVAEADLDVLAADIGALLIAEQGGVDGGDGLVEGVLDTGAGVAFVVKGGGVTLVLGVQLDHTLAGGGRGGCRHDTHKGRGNKEEGSEASHC